MFIFLKKLLGLVALVPLSTIAFGDEAQPAAAKVTYDEHVRPIFREHCLSCHNSDAKKGDLALDNYAAVRKGGSTGEVLEPGDADSSRLWALVTHADEPKMPPNQDKLPEPKLALIRAWLTGGALENSGSVAAASKKPKVDLSVSAGSGKPAGPAIMPEGLFRQPVVTTTRAGAVTALASSPWAPLVAVSGQKQILLYNSDTAKLLGVLPFPEGIPYVLKFSRSGSLLLAGGGQGAKAGRVVVFDVKTGKRVFEVGDELDAVLAADINENHTLIALGGPSRVVRVFSTADSSVVYEIRKHTDWVYALEFSPDGVLLATADRNGGMFVWETATGREYQNLPNHKGAVTDVSWRLDSNILASSSEDGMIKLWEMENGSEVKTWAAHPGGAASVDFARDGKLVSVGRDKITKVWDGNGTAVKAFEPFADIGLEATFTHDGARVVAGDWLGDIRLLNVADGKLVAPLPSNPPTLEQLVVAETAKVTAATALATAAATELTAAQAAVAALAAQGQAATDAFNGAQANATKTEAERVAAAAVLAAAVADAAKPAEEKAAIEKNVATLTAAAKAAADAVPAAKAAADKAVADKAAAEPAAAAKAAASKAASDALAAAQAVAAAVSAEKVAFDQAHPPQAAAK